MNLIRNRLLSSCKLSIILLICIFILGCATAKQIERPDVRELTSKMGEGTINNVIIQAVILDNAQASKLFGVEIMERSLIPILFVVNNKSSVRLELRREHFSAVFGTNRIEPAMPGRAASLLRDSSGSMNAAFAGYLLFGFLAAPAIHEADKQETAAVEAHREVIFSVTTLSPGGSTAGYLFFESPLALDNLKLLNLEYYKAGNRKELINIQLANPYASDANKQ